MICIISVNTIFLQILNAFRTSDDMPVKDLQLKEYNTGEFLDMHVALGKEGSLSDLCILCYSQNCKETTIKISRSLLLVSSNNSLL